jgi:hypothetical protein
MIIPMNIINLQKWEYKFGCHSEKITKNKDTLNVTRKVTKINFASAQKSRCNVDDLPMNQPKN